MEQTRGKADYLWLIECPILQKKEANHDDPPLRLLIILIIPHGRFEVLDDGF